LIREAGEKRYSRSAIEQRLAAAEENSYERRFSAAIGEIGKLLGSRVAPRDPVGFWDALVTPGHSPGHSPAHSIAVLANGNLPPALAELLATRSDGAVDPQLTGDEVFDLVVATDVAAIASFAGTSARARWLWLEQSPLARDGTHEADTLLRLVDCLAIADAVVWTAAARKVIEERLGPQRAKLTVGIDFPSANAEGSLSLLRASTERAATLATPRCGAPPQPRRRQHPQ
jgi:hypothetical protein